MAKHIILNNNGFYRLASTDEVKDFWISHGDPALYTSAEINDSEYQGLKCGRKIWLDGAVSDFLADGVTLVTEADDITITWLQLQKALADYITACERIVSNHKNSPSSFSTDLETLKAIDLEPLISDPDTPPSFTGKNLIDILENNSITVPLVFEI